MAQRIKPFLTQQQLLALALALPLFLTATSSSAQAKYYRYPNKDGVKVISVAIPPEYAQKGYEIITKNGRILQVVAPAPAPENLNAELERRERLRALVVEHESLTRRYSSVDDIFAARDRRLAHLNATISILRNNIANLKKQSADIASKAAESERLGREVSKQILSGIEQTKAETVTSETSLKVREEEYEAINREYQREVDLFKLGPEAFDSRPVEPTSGAPIDSNNKVNADTTKTTEH